MAAPILYLKDIHLNLGTTPLFEGAELNLTPRARLCLVGRNGTGKSTFLKIIAGLVESDKGERFIQPGIKIGLLDQDPDFDDFKDVGTFVVDGLAETEDVRAPLRLLQDLGLTPDLDPKTLSGGQKKRAALAQILGAAPDILLLDEPTNHLDLPTINWLENQLQRLSSALIMISHDRAFLNNLSTQTLWIDRGTTHHINKGFSHFEDWRDDFFEQESTRLHKIDRKIVREEHWVTHGVSGRRKRNMRRLKELHALRDTRANHRHAPKSVNFSVTSGQKTSKNIIEIEGLGKSLGGKKLVKNLDLIIQRGDRIGVIGANGIGKTTLARLIVGDLAPDDGNIQISPSVQLLYLDQNKQSLEPDWTVQDALADKGNDQVLINGQPKHVASYMQDFLFLPEQRHTKIAKLSGGEKARLALARALKWPSNLLLLDEPTNDLDLETLDVLEELIAQYEGTVITISHDRDFLDRTSTHILAPTDTKDGTWQIYPGGYTDWAARQVSTQSETQKPVEKQKQKSTSSISTAKSKPSKLSYKHQRALEMLPGQIEALETQITKLETQLADPNLFDKDPTKFNDIAAQLEKAQKDKDTAEEQWLEIEMMREAFAQS